MNTKQSSTGNVYGIYDLSGGAYEATAAYYNIATNQDLSNNGGELVRKNKQSSKYVTVYNSSILEEGYIIGDATYETKGWNGDHSSFVASNNPFFLHGGIQNGGGWPGIFSFDGQSGNKNNGQSFRECLIF